MTLLTSSAEDTIFATYSILILLFLAIYLLPTFIAFLRNHHYKWIIMICNLFGGWTGVLWIMIFVWSIWPKDKTLIDPIINNPTGTGRRTTGHTFARADYDYMREMQHLNQNRNPQIIPPQQFAQQIPHYQPVQQNPAPNLPKEKLVALEYLQKFRHIGAISRKQYNREKKQILNA